MRIYQYLFGSVFIFLMITLSMHADRPVEAEEEEPEQITGMYLKIGGFEGGFLVEYKEGKLRYQKYKGLLPKEDGWEVIEGDTGDDMGTFLSSIEEIGLFEWDEEYKRDNVYDGTQWTIRITTNKREFKSRGDNDYPGEEDDFLRPGKPFTTYLKAVRDLLGEGRPFH